MGITPSSETLNKAFPLISGPRQENSLPSPLLFRVTLKFSASQIRKVEEIKDIKFEVVKMKVSSFAYAMITLKSRKNI